MLGQGNFAVVVVLCCENTAESASWNGLNLVFCEVSYESSADRFEDSVRGFCEEKDVV